MIFVHFHKSYSRYDDNLSLLIKTANNHQERTLSPTIINTFKNCKEEREREVETKSKMMMAATY